MGRQWRQALAPLPNFWELHVVWIVKASHATTQPQHQVQCRLLLDVAVGKAATVFKPLASKNEPLKIWMNSSLVIDLRFCSVDGVAAVQVIQVNNLPSECFHKDLHAAAECWWRSASAIVPLRGCNSCSRLHQRSSLLHASNHVRQVLDLAFLDIVLDSEAIHFTSQALHNICSDKWMWMSSSHSIKSVQAKGMSMKFKF